MLRSVGVRAFSRGAARAVGGRGSPGLILVGLGGLAIVHHSPARAASTTINKVDELEQRVKTLEAAHAVIRVSSEAFGKVGGKTVEKFTLSNGTCSAEVITYGATLISFKSPDRNGVLGECTINYDTLEGVVKGESYYGATCGRVANRIEKGMFSLGGKDYTLATNNGPNALHGGIKGFDKVLWKAEPVKTAHSAGVKLTYVSEDGEEGYPGRLTAQVIVSLDSSNALTFDYACTTDEPTPLNITNHAYWNLSGEGKRSILTQEAKLYASKYTPADPTAIPFGDEVAVSGPYDLTEMTLLQKKVPHADGFGEPGIDHNYVVDKEQEGELALAAELFDSVSGRHMTVKTTEPGVQCYTMNWGSKNPADHPHVQHNAICFEAQHYPNSINTPSFPNTVLKPGEVYTQTTVHNFTVRE